MKKVLYILGQLSDEDVEWMITKGKKRNVPNGTVLIRERQPHDGFYIVLDGKLSVERGGETVAEIGVGEVVGEMSFVDSRPPTATVSSASDAVLYALDRAELAAQLERDDAFAAHFYKAIAVFLSDRFRQVTGQEGDADELDELDLNVLDNLSLAGARFERLLRRLMEA